MLAKSAAGAEDTSAASPSSPSSLRASVAPSLSCDWLPARELLARNLIPGKTEASRYNWLSQHCARWSRTGDARKDGRNWLVRTTVRINNIQIRALLLTGELPTRHTGGELPPGADRWNQKDRQRFLDTALLLDCFDAFAQQHAVLPVLQSSALRSDLYSRFACAIEKTSGQRFAIWARTRGLTISERTIRRYRDRMDPRSSNFDGNVDSRGRSGDRDIDPRISRVYADHVLHANEISFAECFRAARDTAADLGLECPSHSTLKRWFKAHYPAVAVQRHRGGRFISESQSLPKLQRDYSGHHVLDEVSLDGRKTDARVRIRAADGTWKAARVCITGVLDVASRYLGGWCITTEEHSEAILAGVQMFCEQVGVPRRFYLDNGSAYCASLGSHFRDRVSGVCERLGAELVNATPHTPWAKIIESFWRRPKELLDRYYVSFIGGSPDERPEDAEQRIRANIMALPTLDEYRECFRLFVERYHAEPHSGLAHLLPVGSAGILPACDADSSPSSLRDSVSSSPVLQSSALPDSPSSLRDSVASSPVLQSSALPDSPSSLRRSVASSLTPNLAREQLTHTIRKIDPGVLRLICCRQIGGDDGLLVRRDGVRHNGIRYGHFDEQVWQLQGRRVWLLIDPARADQVVLCEKDGTPLCIATNRVLTGATQEEVREAHRTRSRMRKKLRDYAPARDVVMSTPTQQVLRQRATHAKAREAEQRKTLPAAPAAEVSLVRADLVPAVRQLEKRQRLDAVRASMNRSSKPVQAPVDDDLDDLLSTADTRIARDVEDVDPADLLGAFSDVG